eukprot:SAG11_NODE_235_length_11852_cov_4.266020_10_plen_213_part_00
MRQAGSQKPLKLVSTIPPMSEAIVACSANSLFASTRLWLTYRIVQPGSSASEDPHIRMEVKSVNLTWPFKKCVTMHADVFTGGSQSAQEQAFFAQYDDTDIQDTHADLQFTINSNGVSDATQTEMYLAERNALERMMVQRQTVELEATKLTAFSQVTTILFLLYNVLTSSVFGMFACFDMDFGDMQNRFGALDSDALENFLARNIWLHRMVF